jgi:hypothetical protein
MRHAIFRFCLLFAGIALLGVAAYFFFSYIGLKIALDNNSLEMSYQQMIRALWLTFGAQALLIAALYFIAAYRAQSVTREVVVIFGLIQLIEGGLLVMFTESWLAAVLLGLAALGVLLAAIIWPQGQDVSSSGTDDEPEIDYEMLKAEPESAAESAPE